eukprot:gene27334-biopygen17832
MSPASMLVEAVV